jgi:hypothetical protein
MLAVVLPTWIKPQLAALAKTPPEGNDGLHEIKLDGYRMHARLDHGRVQLLTRTGLNWTPKYPSVSGDLATLHADNGVPGRGAMRCAAGQTTSFASHWLALHLVGPYASLTFQKTGATNLRIPWTFVRNAVGRDHSPHGT